MNNVNALRVLQAELSADVVILKELHQKYNLLHQKLTLITPDEFDYVALAYTIVNLYSLIENYFLRIAKTFENNLEQNRWHKHLLQRMTLDIPAIRPAFMERQDYPFFDELRAFRHVFRHIYQSELDTDRLFALDSKIPQGVERFYELHRQYLQKLETIIDRYQAGEL